MSNIFQSQFNQDEIINTLLKNKREGFFVDIGAYDGVTFSNSFFFEKSNNWKGICFEPNPIIFKKLSEARKCKLINGGVSEKETTLLFKSFYGNKDLEMYSGFSDFFNEEQLIRVEEELKREKNSGCEEIKIQTYLLNNVLQENNIIRVDYCSIDTEGGEFNIIKTINFDSIYFSTFSIENNCNAEELIQYMDSKGFDFIFIWKCDLFFVNKNEKIDFSTKIKLSKYYFNYHLKKVNFLYKPLIALSRLLNK